MAIASDLVAGAVTDADPEFADHGLVDGALLLEGDGGRGAGADHRVQPPGVAARRLSRAAARQPRRGGTCAWSTRGGVLKVIRTTVPWPWAFPTPMTQVA